MNPLVPHSQALPALVTEAGSGAIFAAQEFFYGKVRNLHTRRAYQTAITQFLDWAGGQGTDLVRITPMIVGLYFDRHPGSPSTKQQHRAALRHFFDQLVVRHVCLLNPVATVRLERYQVTEGRTPEITIDEVRKLIAAIDLGTVAGRRDRALIGFLVYTAARVGAVAQVTLGDLYETGGRASVHFLEKNGKSREIPLRADLCAWITEYRERAGLAGEQTPLFQTLQGGELTGRGLSRVDACRLVKRRMKNAGLSPRLSAHSFRVATITNLLDQGVPLEDVQRLAGHADPRTTRLYDRRPQVITRQVVDRIAI
jgi:site-specific recombinase XerD